MKQQALLGVLGSLLSLQATTAFPQPRNLWQRLSGALEHRGDNEALVKRDAEDADANPITITSTALGVHTSATSVNVCPVQIRYVTVTVTKPTTITYFPSSSVVPANVTGIFNSTLPNATVTEQLPPPLSSLPITILPTTLPENFTFTAAPGTTSTVEIPPPLNITTLASVIPTSLPPVVNISISTLSTELPPPVPSTTNVTLTSTILPTLTVLPSLSVIVPPLNLTLSPPPPPVETLSPIATLTALNGSSTTVAVVIESSVPLSSVPSIVPLTTLTGSLNSSTVAIIIESSLPTPVETLSPLPPLPTETLSPFTTLTEYPGSSSTVVIIVETPVPIPTLPSLSTPAESPTAPLFSVSAPSVSTFVIATTMTPLVTASSIQTIAITSSVPSITGTITGSPQSMPTGTPNPSDTYCDVHGTSLGDYYLGTWVENRSGVQVTLEGCYQFCDIYDNPDHLGGCASYEFHEEEGIPGSARCDLYGATVPYVVGKLYENAAGVWFDLACGSPDKYLNITGAPDY